MKRNLGIASLLFFSSVLSCDDGSDPSGAAGATSTDCPIGMFKPQGLTDCVFPAESSFGQQTTVTDNRCASGQPAFPPSCISDRGLRAYLSASSTCAPNYHFEMGVCQRGGGFAGSTGGGGFFETAGTTSTGGFFGGAGSPEIGGAGGSTNTGDFAGFPRTTDPGGATGQSGAGGSTGEGGTTSTGGVTGESGAAGR